MGLLYQRYYAYKFPLELRIFFFFEGLEPTISGRARNGGGATPGSSSGDSVVMGTEGGHDKAST